MMSAYEKKKKKFRFLWNNTMKNFHVRYAQCDSTIFTETLSLGAPKYLLDL